MVAAAKRIVPGKGMDPEAIRRIGADGHLEAAVGSAVTRAGSEDIRTDPITARGFPAERAGKASNVERAHAAAIAA